MVFSVTMQLEKQSILLRSFVRLINTSASVSAKKIPNKAKSHSSNQWLTRQLKDPFVELAQTKNYRYFYSGLSTQTT